MTECKNYKKLKILILIDYNQIIKKYNFYEKKNRTRRR